MHDVDFMVSSRHHNVDDPDARMCMLTVVDGDVVSFMRDAILHEKLKIVLI